MIFYFSATGNSRFVAKVLADHCQDELVCLNDYLKNNSKGEFSSEKPYVLVAPVYAWKIPARVQDCPTGNIRLTDTGISFGDQCMFCLGCINQCPTHAIDCKGKGAQNGRYTCPPDEEILSER